MAQALPLTAVQVLLNRDLGLERRPELVNRFFAVEFSMSTLKPLYAALSDLCPIRGLRRVPYMILGAVAHAAARQGFARASSTSAEHRRRRPLRRLFLHLRDGADGALVQISAGDPKRSMRAQARGMMVRSAGSLVATALSVPLLAAARENVRARRSSAAAAAVASRVREDANRAIETRHRNAKRRWTRGGRERANRERTNRERATRERPEPPNGWSRPRPRRLAARPRRVSRPASDARRRSASRTAPATALVTFTSFTYERFHLPNWARRRARTLVSTAREASPPPSVGARPRPRTLTLAASFVREPPSMPCAASRDSPSSTPTTGSQRRWWRSRRRSLVTRLASCSDTCRLPPTSACASRPGLEAFGYALVALRRRFSDVDGIDARGGTHEGSRIGEGEEELVSPRISLAVDVRGDEVGAVGRSSHSRRRTGERTETRYRRHEDEDEDEDDDDERALGERKASAGGGDAEDVDVEEESDGRVLLTSRA